MGLPWSVLRVIYILFSCSYVLFTFYYRFIYVVYSFGKDLPYGPAMVAFTFDLRFI